MSFSKKNQLYWNILRQQTAGRGTIKQKFIKIYEPNWFNSYVLSNDPLNYQSVNHIPVSRLQIPSSYSFFSLSFSLHLPI